MKEKDIVNFEKMKKQDDVYIDEHDNEIGCEICYTHVKAYKKFEAMQTCHVEILPICPNCGDDKYLDDEGLCVISEVNYSNPYGEIGYYPVYYCDNCEKYFAYMPQQIAYNANHDIYCTGGRDYIENEDQKKLKDDVFNAIKPSIEQYIRRVVDEHEKGLDMWNILLWCERDIEAAIANWLYDHKLKK